MVKEIQSDIFSAPIDMVCHGANCQNTMGSGIAKAIRDQYPEAYEADCRTTKGDPNKLGTFSVAKIENPEARINKRLKYIVNLYTQFQFGRDRRHASYDAIVDSMTSLREKLISQDKTDLVVGINWKIGCALGGCSWPIVEAIIYDVFEESPIQVLICHRPGDI